MDASEKRYLELLSRSFPTVAETSATIIELDAMLNLPKGTEFFASDIHGEYVAFSHILKNACGAIRDMIDDAFGDELGGDEKRTLATLIYYPREKMQSILSEADDTQAWYAETLPRVVSVCKLAAKPYSHGMVIEALPGDFAYVIDELLTENPEDIDKKAYCSSFIDTAIATDSAADLIEELCLLIQRLTVDHLHLVGDVYDRGPAPQKIMDMVMEYPSIDIQWGNHDIVWMGASLGQRGCIAHVVRNCARYANLSILDEAYGIDITPLIDFAQEIYGDDPCAGFALKGTYDLPQSELDMNVRVQKAMAVLQFKVEAQLIDENPSFGLEDRKQLHLVDFDKGTVVVDGIEYEITDKVFPTLDRDDPYRLTPEEENVMQSLEQAFMGCEKLQRHMDFFLEAGNLYRIYNGNLLFHACVPLNADGSLKEVDVFGEKYKGRALYDVMERYVRAGFRDPDPEMRKRGRDLMWYLWLGQGSPLFAKSKMATFEIYMIADKAARKEVKNPFYKFLDDEDVMAGIFEDFGLDPKTAHIVCGHVPVKAKDGEDPVKCNGRAFIIDGGFSKAYQPTTGLAGYTLISKADSLTLASHEPLESTRAAIEDEVDIHSEMRVVERWDRPLRIADTDEGTELEQEIADLEQLLAAYRSGEIAEAGK